MSRTGDVAVTAEFLDAAAIARILDRRQAAAEFQESEAPEARIPVLRWTIGDEQYASPLGDIREVAEPPRITRVPGAPAELRGLVPWRGEVLNLIDPAPLLGSRASAGSDSRMIVLRRERPLLALNVSAVSIVVSVPQTDADFEGLTRFVPAGDGGAAFAVVSVDRLVDQFLARRHHKEG